MLSFIQSFTLVSIDRKSNEDDYRDNWPDSSQAKLKDDIGNEWHFQNEDQKNTEM